MASAEILAVLSRERGAVSGKSLIFALRRAAGAVDLLQQYISTNSLGCVSLAFGSLSAMKSNVA
jgi:molybdopterin biosynthesis enzyme MoaB